MLLKNTFMKYIIKLLLIITILISASCSTSKKFKTITETITVTKIDTVIKYVPDTTKHIAIVPIQDTAEIETESAIARSYFNVKTQKIELTLKGKIIDVPVVIDQVITTKENKTSVERKPVFSNYLLAVMLGALFVLLAVVIAFIKLKLKL
jgi:hypothetical protein